MLTQQTAYLKPTGSATRILYSPAVEQVMFFVRRFVQNVDWICDLLSLIDKLLDGERPELTRFEKLIVQDYLHFRLLETPRGRVLVDRAGERLEPADLIVLRDQITAEADKRALFLYYNPARHPLAKGFKRVLARLQSQPLSAEDHALLREAYLFVEDGEIRTLRGRRLEPPSRSQRLLWKLVG